MNLRSLASVVQRVFTRRWLVRWVPVVMAVVLVGLVLDYCVFWSPSDTTHLFGDQPLSVAHRGASGLAPENTLASFQKALDMGVDVLEMDVHLSKDGEVVVIHDSTVDRTTNGTGKVGDLDLDQLKELDAGSFFSAEYAGEPIPTLQEVIDLAQGRAVLEIDLKTTSPLPTGLESKVVGLIVSNGLEDRVVLQSLNPLTLFYLKRINSNIPTALSYHEGLPLPLRNRWGASLAHPDIMQPSASTATEEHVLQRHEDGYPVVVWTVDDPAEMEQVIEHGVDGVMTNRPDLLKAVLAERAAMKKSSAMSTSK